MVLEWPTQYFEIPGELLDDQDREPIGDQSATTQYAMSWGGRNKRARGTGGVSQYNTGIALSGDVLDGAPRVAEVVNSASGVITRNFAGILTDRNGWEVWLKRNGVNAVVFSSGATPVENDTIDKDGLERGWRLDESGTQWNHIKLTDDSGGGGAGSGPLLDQFTFYWDGTVQNSTLNFATNITRLAAGLFEVTIPSQGVTQYPVSVSGPAASGSAINYSVGVQARTSTTFEVAIEDAAGNGFDPPIGAPVTVLIGDKDWDGTYPSGVEIDQLKINLNGGNQSIPTGVLTIVQYDNTVRNDNTFYTVVDLGLATMHFKVGEDGDYDVKIDSFIDSIAVWASTERVQVRLVDDLTNVHVDEYVHGPDNSDRATNYIVAIGVPLLAAREYHIELFQNQGGAQPLKGDGTPQAAGFTVIRRK